AGDPQHLVGGRQLEVERGLRRLAQQAEVAVLDVAAVLAQVDRDLVGAAELGLVRRRDGVGLSPTPRLPERGDVVDVDPEPDHGSALPVGGAAARPGAAIPPRAGAPPLSPGCSSPGSPPGSPLAAPRPASSSPASGSCAGRAPEMLRGASPRISSPRIMGSTYCPVPVS